jgi:hypothetical protein
LYRFNEKAQEDGCKAVCPRSVSSFLLAFSFLLSVSIGYVS